MKSNEKKLSNEMDSKKNAVDNTFLRSHCGFTISRISGEDDKSSDMIRFTTYNRKDEPSVIFSLIQLQNQSGELKYQFKLEENRAADLDYLQEISEVSKKDVRSLLGNLVFTI